MVSKIDVPACIGTDPGGPGEQHRSRHLQRHGSGGRRDAPRGHAGGAHRATRTARATARCTTPEHVPEHRCRNHRREWRREQSECAPARADRLLEVLARLTATKVRADLPPAQQAHVPRRDALAHELAAHLVALPQVVQGQTGLVDELLTGGLRRTERRADLRVAEAAELAHDDRATLSVGQRGEIGHQRAKLLARLRIVGDGRREAVPRSAPPWRGPG